MSRCIQVHITKFYFPKINLFLQITICYSGSGFPTNIQYTFLFLLCKLQAQTIIITGQITDENKMQTLGGFTNVVIWLEVA
jgi:hypothetical protein